MPYSKPDALVSTEWLAQHLSAPDVRVVDATYFLPGSDRDARAEYNERHIPGAVFVDWTQDITDPDNPVKVQIAPPARFAREIEERGIGDERTARGEAATDGNFVRAGQISHELVAVARLIGMRRWDRGRLGSTLGTLGIGDIDGWGSGVRD